MSSLHITRIEKKLRDLFFDKIDCSDLKGNMVTDEVKLSRSQAALVISSIAEISSEDAICTITDGFDDNGIDCIHIDKILKVLFLIQSKWVKNGTSSPAKADTLKFLHGVNDLLEAKFDKFNDKIKSKKDEIYDVLTDTDYKIEIILAYNGSAKVSADIFSIMKEKVMHLNDATDIFSFRILDQKAIYKFILSGSEGNPIDLSNVTLLNWGRHYEPYESVYGEIEAEKIAELWQEHGQGLLAKNLRQFKGNTTVNAGIKNTISKSPEDFWYFNNGITVLCKNINKSAIHGSDRNAGIFSFKDVSIVNGAQTYGSIGDAYLTSKDEVSRAKVQIRFINLEGAEPDYATRITRYNNTQNRIDSKDFASLDRQQKRIKEELWIDGIIYSYKTGEAQPQKTEGFNLEDATVALACSHSDISYSVIVNSAIGTIWEDIDRPPYKILFNKDTDPIRLWKCVQIMNIVDENLHQKRENANEKILHLAIHGNRFILHKVYKKLGYSKLSDRGYNVNKNEITDIFNQVFEITHELLTKLHDGVFLYTFFKNQSKTQAIGQKVDVALKLTNELFSEEHYR